MSAGAAALSPAALLVRPAVPVAAVAMKRPFSPSLLERDPSVRPRSLDFDGHMDHVPGAFDEVRFTCGHA